MQYALFPYPKRTYHLKRKRASASQGRAKEGPPLYIPKGKRAVKQAYEVQRPAWDGLSDMISKFD